MTPAHGLYDIFRAIRCGLMICPPSLPLPLQYIGAPLGPSWGVKGRTSPALRGGPRRQCSVSATPNASFTSSQFTNLQSGRTNSSSLHTMAAEGDGKKSPSDSTSTSTAAEALKKLALAGGAQVRHETCCVSLSLLSDQRFSELIGSAVY